MIVGHGQIIELEEYEGEIIVQIHIHSHDMLMKSVYIIVLLLVERFKLYIVQI